jgi:MoxR-like ATPase
VNIEEYIEKLNNAYCYKNAYKVRIGNTVVKAYGIIVEGYETLVINNKIQKRASNIIKKGSIIRDISAFKSVDDSILNIRKKLPIKDVNIKDINGIDKTYHILNDDISCKSKNIARNVIAGPNARPIKLDWERTVKYINKSEKTIYATDNYITNSKNITLSIDKECHITIIQGSTDLYNDTKVDNFDELSIYYGIDVDFNEWTGSFDDNAILNDFNLSDCIEIDHYELEEVKNMEAEINHLENITEDLDIETGPHYLSEVEIADEHKFTKEKEVKIPSGIITQEELNTMIEEVQKETKKSATAETTWDANERKAETTYNADYFDRQRVAGETALNNVLGNTVLKVQLAEQNRQKREVKEEKPVEHEPYTADDFKREIRLSKDLALESLIKLLEIKHAMIFVAPPGTGKTTAAIALANVIAGETNSDKTMLVSFNQYTEYTDVVNGLKQDEEGYWKYVSGYLKSFCEKAMKEENKNIKFVLIMDEINRGNPEAVLGEFLTAMSQIGKPVTTNSGDTICMPENVYLVATMNTMDSSVSKLDAALRDRFAIVPMQADDFSASDIKPDAPKELQDAINKVIETINKINSYLVKDIYKKAENRLGMRQLYTDYTDIEGLKLVVKYCIKPQVKIAEANLDSDDLKEIDSALKELDEYLGA